MKLTKEFKLANIVLVSALALAGCGDDPLSTTSVVGGGAATKVALSGKAADGYLKGATVCLDLNKNKECDDGEPIATTIDGGAFTLNATQSQIDAIPLLVEVTDKTVDEDFPDKTLSPYTLSAPAGYKFISPLTSMVQNEIENGSTLAVAEKKVKDVLGTTLSLDSDYIAGKNDATASDQSKASFAKLHKVAQVAASIIAKNMSATENKDYSAQALSSAILVGVIAELETITTKVDDAIEAGDDFDADSLAEEIEIEVNVLAVETIVSEYILISSIGSDSEITENMVIGEWSTGSIITAGNYEGLPAWTVTSAGSWGTVLAFSDGFAGDFTKYNKLKLKIATSGGYSGIAGDGYYLKMSAGGVETADIALNVNDSLTSWQNVELDLDVLGLDLSSIEYITVFAKTGTANTSKIHIADLSLVEVEVEDISGGGTDSGTSAENFVLISSAGATSEINENTVIGEWSTGSVIDSANEFDGLTAWSVTSAGSWGTVLAFTGGFEGDFSDYDQLELKMATSGGYTDGYFLKISTNGVESGDIPLSVSDSKSGWQDVIVDLSNYDLSSIEYITVFAKPGTAGVSKIYVADLFLSASDETDTATDTDNDGISDTSEASLIAEQSAAATLVESSYTTSTWVTLTTALAMPETTQAEVDAKTVAITVAITGLEEPDSVLVEGPNLVVNGDFADTTLADNAGTVGQWNYYSSTGTVVAIADGMLTANVTELGGQWDNQIWNEVQVTEEGDYVVKLTLSSTVDRDILIRVDAIGMNGNGTTSTDSDVIASLTSEPQTFTLNVSGSAFTDAKFKIVTSVGTLEAVGSLSVASTVTYHHVYLGTLAESVPTDTTTLEVAIATAQVMLDGGEDETLKPAYQAAIDAAQAVVDNVDATQTQADAALATLAEATATFDPAAVQTEGNLVVNGNFSDPYVADNAGTVGEWNYYSSTGTAVAIAGGMLTANVTELGGQWDNQIWNEVQVTQEGDYVLNFTASSSVDRDILIRVDAIGMNGNGTTSTASDIVARLTSEPQTFTQYVSGSAFTDAKFKIVTSVGGLEAAGSLSVASTVTYHDVYLGLFEGEIPTDTATLTSAIALAQGLVDVAVEGTEEGQYTTSKADLQTAIDVAQVVLDNAEVTQEQVDVAVAELATAKTTFESGLVAVVIIIPGAQISTPAGDVNYVNDSWGTNTAQNLEYTGDATYSSSIELVGNGSWGTVLAMTGITVGTLAQYDSIEFKIKTTDFTDIKVKVPEVEKAYALASGTALADGWVQMSIPMSDFGADAPAAAVQFAIFGGGGTGTILLTEISFSNTPM